MEKLDGVPETLYVPLTGRIYMSENFPEILNDRKAVEIRDSLEYANFNYENQNQYTWVASATRSYNLDIEVKEFLEKNPNGVIVNLGAGLDTGYNRLGNSDVYWFDLDLPEVIKNRKKFIAPSEKNVYISKSLFDSSWIEDVKSVNPSAVLVLVSGVFYYFEEKKVLEVLEMMKALPNCEVVFDSVTEKGLKRSNAYVKKMGKNDALMLFFVNNEKEKFAYLNGVDNVSSYPYYSKIRKEDLSRFSFKTTVFLKVSDAFKLVKMIKIKLS